MGQVGSGLHYCNLTEDGDGVKRSKGLTLFAIWESAQADQGQKKWAALGTGQNPERIQRGVGKLYRD